MTRRLLSSYFRRVLNPATTPSPKPFSSHTSQQNPLSQGHLFSWQLKPNRNFFFSTYKHSRGQFIAQSRNALPIGRLLTRGAHWLSFSFQRPGGPGQVHSSMRRSRLNQILTPTGVALLLIGANVAVFVLWKHADPSFMRKHFMVSLDNFKSGRLHTLITSAFSHSALDHMGVNMFCLYYFGGIIARLFGPKFLLFLYLGGALGGSIFFLGFAGRNSPGVSALGASSALNAIAFMWILYAKHAHWMSLNPVRTVLMGAILITSDAWKFYKGDEMGLTNFGGDIVAGILWAGIRKKNLNKL
ncbi:hypothetical protein LUZ61_002467 [Rhynchospora tenuis]|uniref:Peptidase S54 rhomboid domain-containing protein n=1 Tax=Rhynchospora tenuis TaxID=198213 RepID=A0AAD5ZIY5_9POAL|nr:hypothetical protein LUZ61_002467 [Rhynchospora tenuis]